MVRKPQDIRFGEKSPAYTAGGLRALMTPCYLIRGWFRLGGQTRSAKIPNAGLRTKSIEAVRAQARPSLTFFAQVACGTEQWQEML